jgi:hypothetical protein
LSRGWERLGAVSSDSLVPARLELHHAAQIVSAVGVAHLPHAADDSHTNLEWITELSGLAGNLVAGSRPFRGAITPADLTLRLLDDEEHDARRLPLSGKTLDEGYVWMAEAIAAESGNPSEPLSRPAYALPDHPAAGGERLGEPGEALRELARWFGNAASLLTELAAESSEASAVRCWPHHFDIATLLSLSEGRTIGLGLSPGDLSYPEPYWYVGPYPWPKNPELPKLPSGGKWHTEGFFAAVLTGTDLLAGDRDSQRERSEEFLRTAQAACRSFLA